MQRLLTVTSAATSRSLTTAAAVEQEIGAADAAYVARLIAQASAAVASHLLREVARETVQEVFRLSDREPHLPLERAPVASIASIVEDGVTLASGDWEADLQAGLLYRLDSDTRIPWCAEKVTVAYSGGWLLPGQTGANLPAEIERATLVTIAAWAASHGRDPQLRSESAEGIGSQSWLDPRSEHRGLPWQVAELLAPWRRSIFA
jgi:hypothetical protein